MLHKVMCAWITEQYITEIDMGRTVKVATCNLPIVSEMTGSNACAYDSCGRWLECPFHSEMSMKHMKMS